MATKKRPPLQPLPAPPTVDLQKQLFECRGSQVELLTRLNEALKKEANLLTELYDTILGYEFLLCKEVLKLTDDELNEKARQLIGDDLQDGPRRTSKAIAVLQSLRGYKPEPDKKVA
jgi:hypothetical protein